MPQPLDKPSFDKAYRMKSAAKRFARGGQIGLNDRKERLRAMLSNAEPSAPEPESDLPDIEDDLHLLEEEPQKPSRKDRIRSILSEMKVESLKKTDI